MKLIITTKDLIELVELSANGEDDKRRFLEILNTSSDVTEYIETKDGLNIVFESGENMILRGVSASDLFSNNKKYIKKETIVSKILKLIKMKIKSFIAIVLFLTASVSVFAQDVTTKKVTRVHDGDGCGFWGESKAVRLMGIDAPEVYSPFVTKLQPMGAECGQFLRNLIKNKDVLVFEYKKTDMYNRKLVVLINDGVDVAETMLLNGMAHYEYSSRLKREQRNRYKAAEVSAKMQQLGVWGQKDSTGRYITPILPKSWRKKHKGR